MRKLLICIATVAATSLATSANAFPNVGAANAAVRSASPSGAVERVHYRNWRHTHRRIYRRGRYYGGGYGYRTAPGIYFSFGQSRRYRDYDYDDYRDYDRGYW